MRVCAYSLCANTCVSRTLVHVGNAVDLRHCNSCVLPLYSIYSAFYLNWQWQFRIRKCFPSLRCTCTYWFMAENSNSWSRIAEERPKENRKANSLLKWGFTARWSWSTCMYHNLSCHKFLPAVFPVLHIFIFNKLMWHIQQDTPPLLYVIQCNIHHSFILTFSLNVETTKALQVYQL